MWFPFMLIWFTNPMVFMRWPGEMPMVKREDEVKDAYK